MADGKQMEWKLPPGVRDKSIVKVRCARRTGHHKCNQPARSEEEGQHHVLFPMLILCGFWMSCVIVKRNVCASKESPVMCFVRKHRHACHVLRLSSQDVPTAYAYELEAATIVQPSQVVEMVEGVWGTAARSVADMVAVGAEAACLERCAATKRVGSVTSCVAGAGHAQTEEKRKGRYIAVPACMGSSA
eukprot:1158375-Pelagomonas_calceolata.AAC.11